MKDLLSYCGLYCGGCKNYKENANCQGCREEPEMVNDCQTRSCAVLKGLLHCGECVDFPCAILDEFYHDGLKHHALALENMREIRSIGVEKWLENQKKLHTCSCGMKLYWYNKECDHKS